MKRSIAILLMISIFAGISSPMGYAEGTNAAINRGTNEASKKISNELSSELSNEDKIIVLPQMELLAGILTQTTEKWDPTVPVSGYDNDYYNELKAFFKPYKNHQAVKLANQLIKENRFTYDAVPRFATLLSELPSLKTSNGYGAYYENRIGDLKRLEAFRVAMSDLVVKSKFQQKFYDKHKDFYDEYITIIKASLSRPINKSVQDLFGYKGYTNIMVLACGLKSKSMYSATNTNSKGVVTVYSTLTPAIQAGHLQF